MKKEIINLCNEIKNNNKCDGCAGKHNNYTCIYCGNESIVLKELEGKLIAILSGDINLDEDILMSLYSIKSLKIDVINKLLEENKYEEKLYNKYADICNKIDNNNLSNDEHKYMLYFIENKVIINERYNEFINILMREMLLDRLNVSNEIKINLIKIFTEMVMYGKVKNPKCVFEKFSDDTVGESFFDRITLDIDEVNNLLDNKNYIKLIEVIWHECTHTYQTYIMLVDKIVNYSNLLNTKDKIIRNSIPGYYDENYVRVSSEVEARYMGACLTLQYLNSLNLELDNSEYFINVMNREKNLFMNQNRVVDGNETTVDDLFLSLNKVELLNRYPVLNVEFKVQDGKLTKKNLEELTSDYENYKNGSLYLNGASGDIEFLYNYLIENMGKNKERS